MKRIIIQNQTYNNLFENNENEGYNSPDNILVNDEGINFRAKDAIPFFVLGNGEVVKCPNSTTHKDYYNAIKDEAKKRHFINFIVLQGRYWKEKNILSFWKMTSDDMPYVKSAIKQLVDPHRDGFVYYKDKVYKINYDDDMIYLSKEQTQQEDTQLDDKKKAIINHWFEENKLFVNRTYRMSTYSEGKTETRDLNDYELFAATCYQVWSDFIRSNNSNARFTYNDFDLYISLKTHGRNSLSELLDYFHNNMRRKLVTSNNIADISTTINKDEAANPIEELLNKLNVDDTEYTITYYEGTELPYSYNIKITDDMEKFKLIIGNAKTSEKINVDRLSVRKMFEDNIMCSCRLRLNAEYDRYWNSQIKESKEQFSENTTRKKIILSEGKYTKLFEAMNDTFSYDELKNLPSFAARRRYCKEHLGFAIGKGSSRECYQIDDDKILKLAINPKGIAQNEQEGQKDWYLQTMGVVPEIYDESDFDDYTYIVSEYVLPAKKRDIVYYTGLQPEEFFLFLSKINACYNRKSHIDSNYDEFLGEEDEDNPYYEERYKWVDYMTNYEPPLGDMHRLANLGISKNNGLVLLDNGLTDEIYDKFYRR